MTSGGLDWAREKWKFGVGSKFIRQGEKNAVKYADEIIVLSKAALFSRVIQTVEIDFTPYQKLDKAILEKCEIKLSSLNTAINILDQALLSKKDNPYLPIELEKLDIKRKAEELTDVLRIGDGQNEKLEIPSAYKDKITLVEKYCTKPELEMLLIISEDLADEYEKVKSKTKPKTFAKANIRCGKRRYDNSTAFYEEYFGQNCEKLVAAIKAYKQHNGSHKKDEHYLAELLK